MFCTYILWIDDRPDYFIELIMDLYSYVHAILNLKLEDKSIFSKVTGALSKYSLIFCILSHSNFVWQELNAMQFAFRFFVIQFKFPTLECSKVDLPTIETICNLLFISKYSILYTNISIGIMPNKQNIVIWINKIIHLAASSLRSP